jgi:hypothetical protein
VPDPRRTFGPTVVIGLAGAGLAAMASHEDWIRPGACDPGFSMVVLDSGAPAAGAVALALLASWGVLLVTRRRVRRAAAVVAAMLSLGLVAAVLLGAEALKDGFRDDFTAGGSCTLHTTGWYWVAVVALPFAVLPALAAVRLVPSWPEMGRTYDAPPGQAAPATPPEEQENLDLWKAMDEGRDPTA